MEAIIRYVDPKTLLIHPENKKYFDDMDGMEWEVFLDDIRENGIKSPLTVQTSTNYVIKGNQRLRAAIILNLETVPVIYDDITEDEAIDELIRDNIIRRDPKVYQKYKLVAILQERIKSRQGEGGGELSHQKYDDSTSVQIAQKSNEAPRDQISKLLGLHSKDIAIANIVNDLPEEKQKEFYTWAKEFDPTRKKLEEKAKQLRSENRNLRDAKKLVKQKESLEIAVKVLSDELGARTSLPDQVGFFMQELERNICWLRNEAPKIINCDVPEEVITGFATSISDFMDQLEFYQKSLRKKFTRSDE